MNDRHGVSRRSILRATALALPTAAATYGLASHAHAAYDLIDGPVRYEPGGSIFTRMYYTTSSETWMYLFGAGATVTAPGTVGQYAKVTSNPIDPVFSYSNEYAAINSNELRMRFHFEPAPGCTEQNLAVKGDFVGWKRGVGTEPDGKTYIEYTYGTYINAGRSIALRPVSTSVAIGPAAPATNQQGTLVMRVGRKKPDGAFVSDYERRFEVFEQVSRITYRPGMSELRSHNSLMWAVVSGATILTPVRLSPGFLNVTFSVVNPSSDPARRSYVDTMIDPAGWRATESGILQGSTVTFQNVDAIDAYSGLRLGFPNGFSPLQVRTLPDDRVTIQTKVTTAAGQLIAVREATGVAGGADVPM